MKRLRHWILTPRVLCRGGAISLSLSTTCSFTSSQKPSVTPGTLISPESSLTDRLATPKRTATSLNTTVRGGALTAIGLSAKPDKRRVDHGRIYAALTAPVHRRR